MTSISLSDVKNLVRKNLDELDPNGSVMYTDQTGEDNLSMDNLIKHFLPEAINAVNRVAPLTLLEGVSPATSGLNASISGGVLSFSLGASVKFLRLVAFRASDSDIVVTDVIPEASAEGRKQLNQHIRGRADRPRLVLLQDMTSGARFKYYSTTATGTASAAIAQFSYVPEVVYSSEANASYNCCARLKQNYIDYITARLMETYKDERAQSYFNKAAAYPAV